MYIYKYIYIGKFNASVSLCLEKEAGGGIGGRAHLFCLPGDELVFLLNCSTRESADMIWHA